MAIRRLLTLVLVGVLALPAAAQFTSIVIPAGSDADKAIAVINAEADAKKKIALLTDFVKQFASDNMAQAFGYQTLAQEYQAAGDLPNALDAIEKANAALPNNLDIVTGALTIAQQANNAPKLMEYAVKGSALYHGLEKQPKAEGQSDADFQARVKEQQSHVADQYAFYESSAFNVITAENDARKRMAYIDQFTPAFPGSKFNQQVAQYALYSLTQLNDTAKMAEFGEKMLASNPNDMLTLVALASTFSEEQGTAHLALASQYAKRAIDVAKTGQVGDEKQRMLSAGMGHSVLGYVLMRQDKTLPAIEELKLASTMLKDDQASYGTVLYRLGFAYAKLNKVADAKATLAEAVKIPGPTQQPSKDLLDKVNAARPARK
jgi:tetratricopeptide (TPR) repeat protein